MAVILYGVKWTGQIKGKNLIGSQFFFTLAPNLSSLDGIHCVIGEVVEGHETLRKINEAIVDDNFRPYQDIRITHTVILEDPFPDPSNFLLPSRSPSPTPQRLQNGRIAADEDIDDTDGKTVEEWQEMLAEREAKARATILEIVGDLPDAEMAPPENVLFVCKLNPVTTDDDLEIIFSRFGKVKNCEVIRDKKTGDSLQYAFVEFDDQKSCEAAYFKMDNVLIDDRRIHVDFSQSVAKVKWRGKGRGVEGSLKRGEFDNLREPNKKHRIDDRYRKDADRDRSKRNNSIERRLAREERHREQREKDGRRENSSHRRRSRYNEMIEEREQGPSRDRCRRSRSHSGGRYKKYSPVRERPDRYNESKNYRHNNEKSKLREYSDHRSSEKRLDRKRQNERNDNGSRKPKAKSERRKKDSTSSSSDSESSSSDTSTATRSSSDVSSDISGDRKRQRRKNRIVKKKKIKSKTHKSKSRRRK
ncbi:PREDICTED: peptidyl-prolyl cis-trans isomerase-like 4 isoform X2 [Bactrocera latifrons]|uniref:peptidyl-prolyl cis-trans isomerase-like 4 isoform X2 n=1 Tax=Bactrocera latifrons TaxID=174628 RepID=UPI0008DC868D|nr:PREDICTED: peptidyl-prolyl cis-trans isomerase-like 4 isoform X2 [Bactrocera latifrons]